MDNPAPDNEEDTGDGTGKSREYRERLDHFIALLQDDDVSSQWKAAEALGRIGDPDAIGDLIDALWDDDERVRLKVA